MRKYSIKTIIRSSYILLLTTLAAGHAHAQTCDNMFFLDIASYATRNTPWGVTLGDLDTDGDLDMVVANSNDTSVLLNHSNQGSSCPPDLNNEGMLNSFDVSMFLSAFAASHPIADFTDDGQFNFFDASAFLIAFNAGCP